MRSTEGGEAEIQWTEGTQHDSMDSPKPPGPRNTSPRPPGLPPSGGLPPSSLRAASPIMQALEERQFEERGSPLRDRFLPAIVLVGGFLIALGVWFTWMKPASAALSWILGALVVQALVLAPLLFLSLMGVANLLELALGTLGEVLWKVGAITFGAAAAGDAIFAVTLVEMDFDWGLIIAGFGYYLILCGLPMAFMLAMNVAETALTLFLMFIPRVVAMYVVALALPKLFQH